MSSIHNSWRSKWTRSNRALTEWFSRSCKSPLCQSNPKCASKSTRRGGQTLKLACWSLPRIHPEVMPIKSMFRGIESSMLNKSFSTCSQLSCPTRLVTKAIILALTQLIFKEVLRCNWEEDKTITASWVHLQPLVVDHISSHQIQQMADRCSICLKQDQ